MIIKTEKFEGPLDLLLQLIEKEELDIAELSLAKIADEYVSYIRESDRIRPEELADFLVVASKLLLIKSRALLPYLHPDEEEDIEEFENQLRMYKEFVEASKKIEKMVGKKKFMFAREFNRKVVMSSLEKSFSPPKNLEKNDLRVVFGELIERIKPAEEDLEEETIEDKINIEDKIIFIQKEIIVRIQMSFHEVLKNAQNKTEIIVSFLAMLELVKQRDVVVRQDEMFADMIINKINS